MGLFERRRVVVVLSSAASLRPMFAKVTIRRPGGTQELQLPAGREVVLGRGADCDVVVDETSVSRHHCRIALRDGRLCLEDLGSAHGLQHRGKRVARCDLGVGDVVRIGAAELRFDQVRIGSGDQSSAAGPTPAAVARPASVPPSAAALGAASAADGDPSSQLGADSEPAVGVVEGPDPLLGQVLGNYRITGLLGAGGSATVYRAEQVQLAREVALKVLRQPSEGAKPEALEAFLREARAAAALADPRLVQVFDFGQDRGHHYLSMEWVRGGSMARRLRADGPIAWRELLPILRDVVGALQLAHQAGLVHRDVKPANVLLLGDGRAKLADLGLVRNIGGAGDRAGTAAFMAPEQLRAAPVDGRADFYALGCTAYAALTGKPPFVGTVKEIVRQKLQDEPAPFAPALRVPPAVDRLIRKQLLARDPSERPQDAAELLAELDELERPTRGGGGGGARRPIVRSRKAGIPTGAVVFVFGLLVIGVLLLIVLKLKNQQQ